MKISAVIFDMDGLLIDSEPFWKAADVAVYGRLGIDLTEAHFKNETTGLRVDASVQHWYQKFPWQDKSLKDVEKEIVDHVHDLIRADARPMRGASELVKRFAARNIPLAVCSSSPQRLIDAAIDALGLTGYFKFLQSAELEEFGKPHPGVYIKTAQRLGVEPQHCLVFEDSLMGAIAGKAARMKVVAVPEGELYQSTLFDFCDAKIHDLDAFDKSDLARRLTFS